ncbi:MAG TPA: serine protease [Patescibacteria group bacterium]|nr:serine protease [Patescibacteria group bacterium]
MIRFPRAAIACLVLAFPLFFFYANSPTAHAAYDPALQAIVRVDCAGRQGSGTVINGDKGYVLTDGHVAIDIHSGAVPPECRVGFIDLANGQPTYFYHAAILKYIFDEQKNRDFAILQIGELESFAGLPRPFPFIKTNEFATLGEPITLYGFSLGGSKLVINSGSIQKFEHGFIETDAEINPGDSGGAALDHNGYLIGVPARIVTVTDMNHELNATYELEDIRAVMIWLDTFGPNEHDKYFTHADYERYHKNAVYIVNSDLDCEYVAKSEVSPTIYCLMNNGDRLVFPNDSTFLSWYPDFSQVVYGTASSIIEYPFERNVTYKPGTLVKSETSPEVYVVIDNFGTLRWIPSEAKAVELWGANWAGLVKDIPDVFWANYTIGQPLES